MKNPVWTECEMRVVQQKLSVRPLLWPHISQEALSMMGEAYKGTNITREKVVNHPRTQLIDALIESHPEVKGPLTPYWKVIDGLLR